MFCIPLSIVTKKPERTTWYFIIWTYSRIFSIFIFNGDSRSIVYTILLPKAFLPIKFESSEFL